MFRKLLVTLCCSLAVALVVPVESAFAQQESDSASLSKVVQQAIEQAIQHPSTAFTKKGTKAPLLEMSVAELRQRSVLVRPVTVHAVNRPLGDVLKMLDRQAELRLVYSSHLVPVNTRISLTADNAPVGKALSQALTGLGVTIVVTSAGQVVLAPPAQPVSGSPLRMAQATQVGGTLRGTVVDGIHKRPLARIALAVTGTDLRAVTDEKGVFQIAGVPQGTHVLVGTAEGQTATMQPFVMVDNAEIQVELVMGSSRTATTYTPAAGK